MFLGVEKGKSSTDWFLVPKPVMRGEGGACTQFHVVGGSSPEAAP